MGRDMISYCDRSLQGETERNRRLKESVAPAPLWNANPWRPYTTTYIDQKLHLPARLFAILNDPEQGWGE